MEVKALHYFFNAGLRSLAVRVDDGELSPLGGVLAWCDCSCFDSVEYPLVGLVPGTNVFPGYVRCVGLNVGSDLHGFFVEARMRRTMSSTIPFLLSLNQLL